MKKVTIQGIAGSFHDIATRDFFNEDVEIVECPTFRSQFSAMKQDPSLWGVVAIENTVAGSILPNYSLLRESEMRVVGEIKMHIVQNLAAPKGVAIEDIRSVESHPMALRQCEEYINQYPKIKMVESDDTASSAKRVAHKNQKHVATICGKLAADIYGLNILAENIETNKKNFTRFLVLRHQSAFDKADMGSSSDKASVVFSLPHEEGSLSKVLTILSFYGINLTKIQSLPVLGLEWQYLFYIDLTYSDYVRYKQALDAIIPLTEKLKVLGEYISSKSE